MKDVGSRQRLDAEEVAVREEDGGAGDGHEAHPIGPQGQGMQGGGGRSPQQGVSA